LVNAEKALGFGLPQWQAKHNKHKKTAKAALMLL